VTTVTAVAAVHRVTLVNREGRSHLVGEDQALLAALEAAGEVLPVGCRYGGCVTCAARLVSGEVEQRDARALKPWQLEQGYVLLCVARPRADCVLEVGVESQDRLYRNPFSVG
jgi:ferredoxin